MPGPLDGIRIIELAGIGPAPFGCMVLSDLGADVVRIDRAAVCVGGNPDRPPLDILARNRRSVGIDLKNPDGVATVLDLVAGADALVEGFRPGVCERLGIGPDVCLERNPALVFARMTGWGQDGPLGPTAGHDINYISIAGALGAIGRAGERPVPPLNLVGDFGGGGMLLALGVTAALLETKASGKGQVVDVAMVDGSALLMSMMHAFLAMGLWTDERGVNMLDTGAPFYDVYETADGGYLSVGSIEPQFMKIVLEVTGLDGEVDVAGMNNRADWPRLKQRMADVIKTRTRDEWTEAFDGLDGCVAPVLSMTEATQHPHNVARGVFVDANGVTQPAPAPRFSRTPASISAPPSYPGQHTDEVLADWGLDAARISALREARAIA
jgi:alpha-methylacyl-CoA racemase